VDLPTYTNIWRIEKRLYKLYDFRLPAPLPINWIAVFAGITVPYVVLLVAVGLPFNHSLVWLYVLPPGVLTWLTTRPVIESKRLPELLESQVRYLTEPRVWCRLAPLSEKDQITVTARVWHSSRPTGQRKIGIVALRERGVLVPRNRGVGTARGIASPDTAVPAGVPTYVPEKSGGTPTPDRVPVPGKARTPARLRPAAFRSAARVRATERVVPTPPAKGNASSSALMAARASLAARPAGPAPALPASPPSAGSQRDVASTGGLWPSAPTVGSANARIAASGDARPDSTVAAGPQQPNAPWRPTAQPVPLFGSATPPVLATGPAHATPSVYPAVAAEPASPAPAPAPAGPVVPEAPTTGSAAPGTAAAESLVPEAAASGTAASGTADGEPGGPAPAPTRVRGKSQGVPRIEVAHSGPTQRPVPPTPEPEAYPAQAWPPPARPLRPVRSLRPPAPPAPVPAAPVPAAPVPPADPSGEGNSRDGDSQRRGADLIAISGAMAPHIAIKSPETSDKPGALDEAEAPDKAGAAGTSDEAEAPARAEASEDTAGHTASQAREGTVSEAAPVTGAAVTGAAAVKSTQPPEAVAETERSPMVGVGEEAQPSGHAATPPAAPAAAAPPAAEPVPVVKVVNAAEEARNRALPSIERALSGPSRDRDLSWHGKVKVVAGATQGPGARDQEALDRTRARLPLKTPKRVLMLGCTSGAGQTVTTLMTGHILASLREQPVAAVDLNDGTLARYSAPAAWLGEIMAGKTPRRQPLPPPDGMPPRGRDSQVRLDVIASHDPIAEGDEEKFAECLGRYYPLTMLDPGANGLTRLLKVTDQLVVVVPASVDVAGALADTRDWLDAHGFADLAANSVTLINGVSKRSIADVERAESVARGRCRAIVRVPWDDMLPVGVTGPSTLRPQTRVAYTALAGVLVAGMAAAPIRMPR
jgi:hypothetical protein